MIEFLQQALADPVVLPALGGAGILVCAKYLSTWADRDEKESR